MQKHKEYSLAVFVGRFQPLHNGHITIINQAFQLADNVLILIGSVNGPRTFKNPFTFNQRADLISSAFWSNEIQHADCSQLIIEPVKDSKYNNAVWIEGVQEKVAKYTTKDSKVTLIGYHKDDSSNYLNWFPQWDYVPVKLLEDASVVDATTVRNILFEGLNTGFVKGVLPNASYKFLEEFKGTAEYDRIRDEYEVVKAYKKSWEAAPYAPTFVCADCLVLCAGHVLLIQRGAQPGKGQWALPGGFINQFERIEDAAIRELREETKIKVPEPVLRGSIKKSAVFDHPDRSLRGRTISHVFRFDIELDDSGKLPKVKGSDDAQAAKWIPLSEVNEDDVFEDHYRIMTSLVGTV